MLWKQITLVGVGLLGGSIGLAVRERRLARRVVGLVRREASVAECRQLRVVDEATLDMPAALKGADLVILGTPLLQMRRLVDQMAPLLKPGAIVTDVGSVKGSLVRDLEKRLARQGVHFVGSHPMAGGEKMGPGAARPDLFVNAVCAVTPGKKTSPAAVKKIEKFWTSLGGRVLRLAPKLHDQLVARSSHLPHVVASALAASVLDPKQPGALAQLCATGFRDTTRVASGSPEMWRDIAIENRDHILSALGSLQADLQQFARLLEKGEEEQILRYFQIAKARRDAWLAANASPSLE